MLLPIYEFLTLALTEDKERPKMPCRSPYTITVLVCSLVRIHSPTGTPAESYASAVLVWGDLYLPSPSAALPGIMRTASFMNRVLVSGHVSCRTARPCTRGRGTVGHNGSIGGPIAR